MVMDIHVRAVIKQEEITYVVNEDGSIETTVTPLVSVNQTHGKSL